MVSTCFILARDVYDMRALGECDLQPPLFPHNPSLAQRVNFLSVCCLHSLYVGFWRVCVAVGRTRGELRGRSEDGRRSPHAVSAAAERGSRPWCILDYENCLFRYKYFSVFRNCLHVAHRSSDIMMDSHVVRLTTYRSTALFYPRYCACGVE